MQKLKAEIISIGNELLSGLTVNTNASFVARELSQIGVNISKIFTIADTPHEIQNTLKSLDETTQIVIITGGLGPTPDDLTKKAIAGFFNTRLVLDKDTLQHIKKLFEGRGIKMPDINRDQAMIPAGAHVLPNKYGTAPGLEIESDDRLFYFLPGVPYEMKSLLAEFVTARIRKKYSPVNEDLHIFRTNGLAESKFYEKVKEILENKSNDYNIAFLPKTSGVDLRIKSQTGRAISQVFLNKIRKSISDYIYTENNMSFSEVIGDFLIENKYTLAIGESFTGGILSDWISNVAGCSQYFMGSVVAYSNESKIELLDVPQQTLEKYGAVSYETVGKMAQGVQKRFKTDCAIASTGIAGPGGATADKPVGLCYLAALVHDRIVVKKYNFGQHRRINKERGAAAGLELLRRLLVE